MLAEADDRQTMIKGVRLAREILAQLPLADKNGDEIFLGENCQSDEAIVEFFKGKMQHHLSPGRHLQNG
ncbi:hypothetical protein SG34_034140 [Thalassomonas viridans]|uniref:Uncharacterized protein n=1 Tax=Thalassomonas viridans TaxID=137584 RepID=A0AAF0CEU8_9GAMM|nr:hypothetical protein [Thalassomonas viridans]WDE08924.1 hypothetical protein SG34_034140 [Thalassomonas viridans]